MKRLTSFLLVFALLLSLIPTAFAGDVNESRTAALDKIDSATVWSYLDDGSDPAGNPEDTGYDRTSWTAADFNDSEWETAPGSFGAKNGDTFNGAANKLEGCPGNDNNIPTYYFRTKVYVADASDVTKITGSIAYDDAVILYINGVKVKGFNDDGCNSNSSFCTNIASASPVTEDFTITDGEALAALKDGENVVAVELHNRAEGSSDIYFAMSDMTFSTEPLPVETKLLDGSARWTYLDNNTDPATGSGDRTSWTAENFSTDGWKTATGPFGSKRGAASLEDGYTANTVLDGCDGTNDTPAYFFRTTFNITSLESLEGFTKLKGTLEYDDGVIVYINGQRVAGFDDSGISENLQYGGSNAGTPQTVSFELLDLSILQEGENTIAVELHQGRASSSDVWFHLSDLSLSDEKVEYQSNISLSMGSDESQMNFTWYSALDNAVLTVADSADMTGAKAITATATVANDGQYSCKATATDLEPGTKYYYQLSNEGNESNVYSFRTDDGGDFSFAFVGDPQIGASGNTANDAAGWENTLNIINTDHRFSGVSFLMSAGDQINAAADEAQYDSYLDHDVLTSLPVATTIGNHDSGSNTYSQHFNVPNESNSKYGKTAAGGDYYFTYNNALFMVLNSNAQSADDVNAHKAFMEAAIEATQNKGIQWKIVMFHHTLFTVASHAHDGYIDNPDGFKAQIIPVLEALDVDVVLQGHDHVYCRTYMMDGTTPITDSPKYEYGNGTNKAPTAVNDTGEILYVTANSGSGSKNYGILNETFDYSAVQNQNDKANASKVTVSDDQFTITTYCTSDMSVVDSFTIKRTASESLQGNGTEASPYKISTADELVFAATQMNAGNAAYTGKYYILTKDINLNGVNFTPIDTFTGNFNGNGKSIRNLTINDNTTGAVADYGVAFVRKNSGSIHDVTFENAAITTQADSSGNGYSGAAVVAAENCQGGVIRNVAVKDAVVTAHKMSKAAGITALNGRDPGVSAEIRNCSVVNCQLTAGPRTAGNSTGLIMGGIAAYSATSTIQNCYVKNVTMTAASSTSSPFNAGLICGYASNVTMTGNVAVSGTINCDNNTTFSELYLGGTCPRVGLADKDKMIVHDNLVGNNAVVINNHGSKSISCYFPGTTMTADSLTEQETYENLGWDFESTWKMVDGTPVLMAPGEQAALRLSGAGTQEDPFQIKNAVDLMYMTRLLNAQDQRVVGKVFALTADIDLNGVNFTPIDNFTGTLKGSGHTIQNLTIDDKTTGDMGGEYRVAFIRINTGTVKDIVFASPKITTQALSTGGYSGAAVIVGDNANGGVISGCTVTDATVSAPNLPKAAGIAVMNGRAPGVNAAIRNCVFEGTLTCGPRTGYGPQLGGITAYSATSTIENCLAKADMTCLSNDSIQSTRVHAGLICGYPNNVTFRGNVAYGGSITIQGEVKEQNLGRIYGLKEYNNILKNNIACGNITINGSTVPDTDKNQGTTVTADSLTREATYQNIGWNFDLYWEMNDGTAYPNKYPVPKLFEYSNNEINQLTAVISGDNAQTMGFTWYYQAGKTMEVQVSKSQDFSNAQSFTATGTDTCYRAKATGLNAGTKYYYQVVGDGKTSKIGVFTTADQNGPFTFLSVADTEADDFMEAATAASSLSAARLAVPNADFILHSGDFVSAARGEEGWQDLLYQASGSLLSMPLVPTPGEEDEEDEEGFLNHFNLNNTYYSFDYANAHFIVLDTNDDETQCLSDDQIAWLKEDVEKTNKDWVILSMHKGPYTSGSHANDGEITALRNLFINELDGLGIDLVIQGHDHIMGHTYDLKDGKATGQPVYTETINGKRFDYTVDPQGLVYMMSGGAGSEIGRQMNGDDLNDYIMQFARSDGRGNVQTFAAITVDGGRLSVATYEIKIDMEPTMIEGFGIDKEVGQVEKLISNGNTSAARKAYNALSSAQKDQVSNYQNLIQAESSAVAGNGGAWLDTNASQRRSIVVRNDTNLAFSHAPVLVKIENAPSETMAFYTTQGEQLPYEIESYDAGGTSSVWVKVPKLPAESAVCLWVYFGGAGGNRNSQEVWGDNYALVEHFGDLDFQKDSTGKQTGTLTGSLSASDNGSDKGAAFANSKITYGSIGDDYNHISVSAVVSMDQADVAAMSDGAGIVSKYTPGNPRDKNTYLLGIKGDQLHSYYGCMWWRTNTPMVRDYYNKLLADGQPHLITVSYDGFTVETFIDGKTAAWQTVFIESAAFLDPQTLTTIGAYSSNLNDQVSGGFHGTIYDVQINGARMTTQWESFRYSNYFGDAVTVGQPENQGDLTLTVDQASRSVNAEAGKQTVTGVVSADATMTARVNGKTVDLGTVQAGDFAVSVPVNGTGEQTVELTAEANGKTATASLTLTVVDTTAPGQPTLTSRAEGEKETLTAQTVVADGDTLTVDFRVSESIPLDATNTKVAQGSTGDKTPADVDPAEADYTAVSGALPTTTVADGTNPYQIYKVTLTEAQAAEGSWRFCWQGESSRQVHAYGYDFKTSQWVKLASSQGTGKLTLNVEMEGTQYTKDNTLYLMIFRGMGIEVSDLTSFTPQKGQYDFTMFWNSDTQYMSQFYEELHYEQYQWIADTYREKNGVITFNTGDISNRSNLNYEYNWTVVDKTYDILEKAGVPYTFSWGNHDLMYDNQPNERRYYQTYFPTDRMNKNTGDWELTYGPGGTKTMCLKQTIQGAKLMVLSLAYNYYLTPEELNWAKDVVQKNTDYTVIIITHNFADGSAVLNTNIKSQIVDPNPNVKMVLCGHIDGAAVHKMSNGGFTVLQDYQGETGGIKYGGSEFMRLIQFDVENDLVYFNTYSPMTGETLSPYGKGMDKAAEGLYQKNGDEFALSIALNGDKTRTFTTDSLTLSAGQAEITKEVSTTEGQAAATLADGLTAEQEYLWYVVLTDSSGNTTVSPTVSFTASKMDQDKTCTITFNANGGEVSETSAATDENGKLASLPTPTHSGSYSFKGWYTEASGGNKVTADTVFSTDTTIYAQWTYTGGSSSVSSGSSSSNTTVETVKNPDGSTTTTTTNKATGTVTEVTKKEDGSTTTVETKKDGTVTETNKAADGTTGTVTTDKSGNITEVKSTVSAEAVTEAAKTGETVTLPVEVPAAKTTEDAPAVQVTVPKSAGSVKVEVPVENVTPGTVAVIVKADGTEEIVSTSIPTEIGVALTLDGSATVKIVDNAKVFVDVHTVNHWAEDAVDFASARGITGGTSDTTFSPDASCTRAQIVTFLWRAAGSPEPKNTGSFTDVFADSYYAKAVAWAVENGITGGTGDGKFSPDATCTREQTVTFLYRASGNPAVSGGSAFSDVAENAYYANAVAWAEKNEITSGIGGGLFGSGNNCTRGQVVTFLYRFMAK